MHFYLAVRMTFMLKTEPNRTAITPKETPIAPNIEMGGIIDCNNAMEQCKMLYNIIGIGMCYVYRK
jgi:hypothetical protein